MKKLPDLDVSPRHGRRRPKKRNKPKSLGTAYIFGRGGELGPILYPAWMPVLMVFPGPAVPRPHSWLRFIKAGDHY